MSAGHHHKSTLSTAELEDLVDEALANPKIKARLAQPFKLITTKDVPLLGSSSIGALNVYLDQHLRYRDWPYGILPVDGRRLDTKVGLIRHERFEQAVEDELGWPYMPIAHPAATVYEHRDYRAKGFDPAAVERAYRPYIRTDEHEPLKLVPTDLDLRPMLHDAKLLERTKAAQDKEKRPHEAVSYVDQATPSRQCAACEMFIKPEYGGPNCTAVQRPILPAGGCRIFKRGTLDKPKL
jgi:hypothetical protein